MRRLLTVRIVGLLDLLRRSGTLANRREFGLSSMEWRIMAQVGEHAPLSLNGLADLLNLDRGQLSRAVKVMVERGLLDRRRKPGGPAVVITLTDEGKALHARMVDLAFARNTFLVGDLPQEEIERLDGALAYLRERATALLERERSYGDGLSESE
jgi:DNA-binding MarR family transcriptional regulator